MVEEARTLWIDQRAREPPLRNVWVEASQRQSTASGNIRKVSLLARQLEMMLCQTRMSDVPRFMLFKVQCQGPTDSIWCTEAEIENEFPAYAVARSKSMGRGVSCRLVADDGQVVSQVSPIIHARRFQ